MADWQTLVLDYETRSHTEDELKEFVDLIAVDVADDEKNRNILWSIRSMWKLLSIRLKWKSIFSTKPINEVMKKRSKSQFSNVKIEIARIKNSKWWEKKTSNTNKTKTQLEINFAGARFNDVYFSPRNLIAFHSISSLLVDQVALETKRKLRFSVYFSFYSIFTE